MSSRSPANNIWVIHDLAYAAIAFDGYKAPSILQVRVPDEIAVEFYSCPRPTTCRVGGRLHGWQQDLVAALAKIKSYLDYGMFTPIQVAVSPPRGTAGLRGRDPRDVPESPRRVCATASTRWAGSVKAQGDNVCLGADPEPYQSRWVRWSSPRSCCVMPGGGSPGIGFGHTVTTMCASD